MSGNEESESMTLRSGWTPEAASRSKAVTPEGDPVELSSTQARQLADALLDLADRDDAD
jgi:hypothetical protein